MGSRSSSSNNQANQLKPQPQQLSKNTMSKQASTVTNMSTLSNELDPVSCAIIKSMEDSYFSQQYNIPFPIIRNIYDFIGISDDLTLWLDASDKSTLTLDNTNCVLEWKSKSNNGVTLKNLNKNSIPTLIFSDDKKHCDILGVQYSFTQTHVMSCSIDVWTILSVHKYKNRRIGNPHATFYILTKQNWVASQIWQLHGSNFGSILHGDRKKKDLRRFWLNGKQFDPVKTKYWDNEFKVATLELNQSILGSNIALPIQVDQIGKERNCHAFEGVLAECFVYKTQITQQERDIIQTYFRNKYKL